MNTSYKFTIERQQEYLAALRRGVGKVEAARSVGVGTETVRRQCQQDPEFKAAREAACSASIEAVENALYINALNGNVSAQIFYLCNRAPYRWMHRVHAPVLVRRLNDEDLLTLARQLFAPDENSEADENPVCHNSLTENAVHKIV